MVLLAAAAEAGNDCCRGGVYSPQWLTGNPFGLRMTLRGRTRGSRRKDESTCLPLGNVGSSLQLVGASGAFVVCGGDWQGGEEEEKEEQGGRDYYGGQGSSIQGVAMSQGHLPMVGRFCVGARLFAA
ncbi:unnamed protein product [Calypogeia fissa]